MDCRLHCRDHCHLRDVYIVVWGKNFEEILHVPHRQQDRSRQSHPAIHPNPNERPNKRPKLPCLIWEICWCTSVPLSAQHGLDASAVLLLNKLGDRSSKCKVFNWFQEDFDSSPAAWFNSHQQESPLPQESRASGSDDESPAVSAPLLGHAACGAHALDTNQLCVPYNCRP